MNMEMFAFGARRKRVNRRGDEVEIGDYALHIQCPWRIYGADGIVVGSEDRRYPAVESVALHDFDPDSDAAEVRCEVNIKAWLTKHAADPLRVEQVETDSLGGFRLRLTHGDVLEAVPVDSCRGEYSERWRLFRPGSEGHFVVTGYGIEGESNQTN